jgi:hypothetical protein
MSVSSHLRQLHGSAIDDSVSLIGRVRRAVSGPARSALTDARPDQPLWRPGHARTDVTLVVSALAPSPNFRRNLLRLIDVLDERGVNYEIVAMCRTLADGAAAVGQVPGARLRIHETAPSSATGAALRAGLATGEGRYLGVIDLNGDLDPETLSPFLSLVDLYEPDIVVGSKRHPLSDVDYPPLRRAYSVAYQLLIRALFRLNLRDTQTGLKLVRREVLAAVLPRMVEKRFAFDLELLVVAKRLGYRRFLEAPVRAFERFPPAIPLDSVKDLLVDTLAVFYRAHVLHFYDRPVRAGRRTT